MNQRKLRTPITAYLFFITLSAPVIAGDLHPFSREEANTAEVESGDFFGFLGGNNSASDEESDSTSSLEGSQNNTSKIAENTQIEPINIPYDPAYEKINLSVSPFKIGAAEISPIVSNSITSQMINALNRVKNFNVLDREALQEIAAEIELSQSNLVSKENRISDINIPVAKYIVRGVVTEFNQFAEGSEEDFEMELGVVGDMMSMFGEHEVGSALSIANPSVGNKTKRVDGKVKMDIKIIEVRTGTIKDIVSSEGTFSEVVTGESFGILGIESTQKQFKKSVLGQATRIAINDSIKKIYDALKSPANENSEFVTNSTFSGDANSSVNMSGVSAEEAFDLATLAEAKEDYQKAAKWYAYAAKSDITEAQLKLATLHRKGLGVKKNHETAAMLYKKAAAKGNASAQYNLGLMYSFGYGLDEDATQAKHWLQKASQQGHKKASSMLSSLN